MCCAVCVANGHCELQDLAIAVGMDHVRYEYLAPECAVDISASSASASITIAACFAPAACASATRSRACIPGMSPAAAPACA